MKKSLLITGAVFAAGLSAHAGSTTIADWTFETSVPATAGPFSPETGAGSVSGSHATTVAATYSSSAGNGSAHSYSAQNWATGDYWQFQVSTLGLKDIFLSFDQVGSNTGPDNFKVQYSTDGASFTDFSTYSLLSGITWSSSGSPNAHSTFTDDFTSVTGLNNASSIYIRLVDLNSTAINGGNVGATGTDRIDNVIITADSLNVPEQTCTLGLLGLGVVGLGFTRRLTK